MASAVLLPKLGNSVESSIILAWHKAVGDLVAAGEVLAEIETDKATLEVESPADGLLLARFYEAGAEVTVMAPIGAIGAAGEDVADLRPHASETTMQPLSQQPRTAESVTHGTAPALTARGRPASSPRARKLAAARGLPLDGLTGSGPGGRILERDVQAALGQGPASDPRGACDAAAGRVQRAGPGQRVRWAHPARRPHPRATVGGRRAGCRCAARAGLPPAACWNRCRPRPSSPCTPRPTRARCWHCGSD